MDMIARIRQEIERLIEESDFDESANLYSLLSFLSTLESGKPMNPDDAMKELDEKIALVKQRGTWDGVDVDKYMDEVRGREPEKPVPNDLEEAAMNYIAPIENEDGLKVINFSGQDIKDAFIAGYNLCKEQMMKEAVEGEVMTNGFYPYEPRIVAPYPNCPYNFGDKVRVIIVKEN